MLLDKKPWSFHYWRNTREKLSIQSIQTEMSFIGQLQKKTYHFEL